MAGTTAVWFLLLSLAAAVSCQQEKSAAEVAYDIYQGCLSQYSASCIKPKALAWMSRVARQDEIKITDDMYVVKTGDYDNEARSLGKDDKMQIFDNIDGFLATHSLKIKLPEELTTGSAGEYVPRSLLQGLPEELNMPLTDSNPAEGRGFVKKVMIPFLVGLKFKTSVLVPLALALIALKTWKALTLGLISLVLTGAMVIFKFTKPKVVNYEVIHVPAHHHEPHLDHMPAPGWASGPYKRSFDDAQEMAYSAYV